MRKIQVFLMMSLLTGHICSQTPWCLENDITHAYLNDFSYDDYLDDYNVSFIMEYFNKPHDYRLDAPKPVRLSWTHASGAEAQRIEVSESSTYDNAYVYSVHADSAAYDVYNLIPGKTYYYRVVSTSGGVDKTVGSGTFETTGLLRMILAEGTWNVRDAGGWISGLTGQPIAYGKIFRGAQLKAKGKDSIILSKDGIDALRMVRIRAELDLRSNDQVPSHVSALAGADYAVDFTVIPEAVNARMYHFQNNDATIRELQWIINRLKQNKPVYYHCQNGADRTGTLGFLIGALLGMSEGDLAKDYELTTFCEAAAAAYDPTEVGFARLRNYEGKKGSPLGSSEDNKEYMFAELANTMKSVTPASGTYQQKIYNFFRTGVNGTKISPADLSWFIKEMTGYLMLGSVECDVDSLNMESGDTHQLITKALPEGCDYKMITYKSLNPTIAQVSEEGLVTAVGGGSTYIIVDIDGISKSIPVNIAITEDNIATVCVENDLVHSYLSEVSYDNDDYTVSYIGKYDTVTTSYRKDWPVAANLQWVADPDATEQVLNVSEDPGFVKIVAEATLDSKTNSYYLKQLKPQTVYYYSIISSYTDKPMLRTTFSAFKTEGTVMMIKAEGVFNVRDFGGWTGIGGHKVQYGKLFRGSRLKGNASEGGMVMISSDYVQVLRDLGVGAELDLRTDEESKNNSTSALNRRQVKYERIADANTCQGEDLFKTDANIRAIKAIIEWLKVGRGVYVSGSLGADRTGTIAFLVNGLLGVDEDGLSKDYELSSFSEDELEKVSRKRTDANFVAMVNKIKSLEGETLQQKIYNHLKTGVNGTAVSAEDLDWFIGEMLGCEYTQTRVVADKTIIKTGKIFNLLGQEVKNPGRGIYIMDGRKYVID